MRSPSRPVVTNREPMPDETRFHSFSPRDGHGLRHDPLNSIVGPRPIGWISSQARDGPRNLAPYSFFNLFNYRPPILGFASVGWKDSVANIQATGEFVWNLVTHEVMDGMNRSSETVPAAVDEFALSGLTPLASEIVAPARVAEARVSMECRLAAIHRLTDAGGTALDSWLVLGEAVRVHIDRTLVPDGTYETARARPVLRGGGPSEYFTIDDAARFDLARPDATAAR